MLRARFREAAMPFCPSCKYEYVDGKTECIDCGAALVDELPVDADTGLEDDDVRYVAFRSYASRVHAEMVREVLANEGISAVIKGDEFLGTGTGLSAGGVSRVVLWIPEDEKEDACRIADSILDPI